MLLWVYLILYDLQTSTQASRHVIKRKLNSLPKDLPDLYNRILRNIKPEDLEVAKAILRWVVWAERPLTLHELTVAIAIRPGQRSMEPLSEMMEPDLEGSLRSILGAMIIIQKNEVHLIHQSAKDFLKDPIWTESEKFSLRVNEANLYISISCLTYLSFEEFEYAPVDDEYPWNYHELIERQNDESKFFRYSSTHWLDHLKNVDAESEALLQMKAAYSKLAKSRKTLTLLHRIYCDTRGIKIYRDYQPIEIAASFGLIDFLEVLLDQSLDVSAENYDYGHILLIAIEFEQIKLVRFLVERGADVNGQDGKYDAPLHKAIERGNDDLVHFLVEKGADVNVQDGEYRTPLHKAIERGNGAIVRFLVENQANVNLGGGEYGNPLQAAIYQGFESIVPFLIENGADVNAEGDKYRGPLQTAIEYCNDGTTHFLVQRSRENETQEGTNESERIRAHIALQKQKELIEKLIEAERVAQRIAHRNSPEYREKDCLRRRERSKEREAERPEARKASLPVSPLSSPTLPRPQDKALPASEPGSPYQSTDLQANESNKQLPPSPWGSPTLPPKPQETELPLSVPDSPYQFADIFPAISLKQLPSSPWDSPTLLPRPQNEPLPISLPGSPYSLSESRVQNLPELPMSPWDSPTLFPIPQEMMLPASLPGSPYSLSEVRGLPEMPISPWSSPIVGPSPLEKILPHNTPDSPYVLAETSENLPFLPVSPLDSPTLLPKFQDFKLQPNIPNSSKEELDTASDFTVPNAIGSFIDTAVVQRPLNPQQQENVDKEQADALEELPTNKYEVPITSSLFH
jgi:ankyrin repeat protein